MATILKTNYNNINHGTLEDIDFPDTLYKYRDWEATHHDRFIKNREVYLASPSSFEDPNDCKTPIRYDLLNEQQTYQWFKNIAKLTTPQLSIEELTREYQEWKSQDLFKNSSFLKTYQKNYNKKHALRRGVLSLTAEPCLSEMWLKYANKHTGLCIGYNTKVLFEFLGGGGMVEYLKEIPIILPKPFMSNMEITSKRIFCKETKWAFEKEYRAHMFWKNPTTISKRQIELPKSAFKEVILGSKITDKNRIEITKAVYEKIGEIPILDRENVCQQCL